jgi:hypothetical protein
MSTHDDESRERERERERESERESREFSRMDAILRALHGYSISTHIGAHFVLFRFSGLMTGFHCSIPRHGSQDNIASEKF